MRRTLLSVMGGLLLMAAPSVAVADDIHLYKVQITNVTADQYFTPALVFTQMGGAAPFFMPGKPASPSVEALAESGDTSGLIAELGASGTVMQHASVPGLIGPGESAYVMLQGGKKYNVGLASMLIPTNDAFIAAHAIALPKGNGKTVVTLPAMDAGSEMNDELCASIPGPQCGGEGVSAEGGEGYIHVHRGIHGVGDLDASHRDWRNPVARITVSRIDTGDDN